MGVHVCNLRPGPLSPNCCKGQSSPDYRGEENTDKHQRLSFQIAKSMEDTSSLGSSQHAENRVYKITLSLDTSSSSGVSKVTSYRPEVSGVPRTVSVWWSARVYRELRKSEKCCPCYCRVARRYKSEQLEVQTQAGRLGGSSDMSLLPSTLKWRALLIWKTHESLGVRCFWRAPSCYGCMADLWCLLLPTPNIYMMCENLHKITLLAE